MLKHVQEFERAYAPKVGCRIPPRTPWDEQRTLIVAGLRAAPTDSAWPVPYTIHRLAWHILDHVWEKEDRSSCPSRMPLCAEFAPPDPAPYCPTRTPCFGSQHMTSNAGSAHRGDQRAVRTGRA